MAKVLDLYKDGVPIGTASFIKAKNGYKVFYNDNIYFDNLFVPLEEFEDYKTNLKLIVKEV